MHGEPSVPLHRSPRLVPPRPPPAAPTPSRAQGIVGKLCEHVLRNEGDYKHELITKIIETCSQSNFEYISNFEWYLRVLMDLVQCEIKNVRHGKQVCPRAAPGPALGSEPSGVATGVGTGSRIGCLVHLRGAGPRGFALPPPPPACGTSSQARPMPIPRPSPGLAPASVERTHELYISLSPLVAVRKGGWALLPGALEGGGGAGTPCPPPPPPPWAELGPSGSQSRARLTSPHPPAPSPAPRILKHSDWAGGGVDDSLTPKVPEVCWPMVVVVVWWCGR